MGLFKKKADPIAERTRALNDQIAALEKQIARLSDKLESQPEEPPPPPEPEPPSVKVGRGVPPEPPANQPRLRSTAFPQSRVVIHSPTAETSEPVFEDVPNNPFKANGDEPSPEPEPDIGVRKGNLAERWERLRSHLRGPPAANPKLVSYLAAGSVQGLRPLRYEKRITRNRAIALMVLLILVIWGLLAYFLKQ
jgi:hypothetical protein